MKKTIRKFIVVTLVLIMSLSCFSTLSFATEPETAEHLTEVPEGYVGIYTKDDLDNIKLDMAGKYILMNDIVFDASDYEKGGSFYNSGKGWEPIGTESTNFRGVFDGNGYKIKNLYINNPEQNYIGLFGVVEYATISNVYLENVDITGKYYVGGIVGESRNISTISYCVVGGEVNGAENVGGIVGKQYLSDYVNGTNYIKYCMNAAPISGNNFVGGIVGYSHSYYSYSGYYGDNYRYSDVIYCANTGTVKASGSYAGGVVGYSTGNRLSQTNTYCYNTGNVSATSYAGGLIGSCSSSYTYVTHCYSVGTVTATSNYGGCFGSNPYSSTFCYYLDEGVTNPTCTVGISKSEDQMKKATAYEQWDFKNTWTMAGRTDYPYPELISVPLVLPEDYLEHEHTYTSFITKEPTHLTTGVMTYTCECGNYYTTSIDKTTDHSYTSTITTPATHTTTGVRTYTCTCGDIYTEVIAKTTEHTYNAVVTAPTCTEQGFTTHTCECGSSYIDTYVSAIDHIDTNTDGNCDNCGTDVGVEDDSNDDCSCNCHKSGITKFFFNFILFFQRLFGANKECACGVAHY